MDMPNNSEPPWRAVEHGGRWLVMDAASSTICTCILREDAELIATLPALAQEVADLRAKLAARDADDGEVSVSTEDADARELDHLACLIDIEGVFSDDDRRRFSDAMGTIAENIRTGRFGSGWQLSLATEDSSNVEMFGRMIASNVPLCSSVARVLRDVANRIRRNYA